MTAGAEVKRNILVVDDEPQITRVLRTALAGHGYNVRTASDGDEAMEIMREWRPELVITDLSMPKRPGWGVWAEGAAAVNSPAGAPPIA